MLRAAILRGKSNGTGRQTDVPAGPALSGRNSVAFCGDHPYVFRMLPLGVHTLKLLSNPCGPSPCDRFSLSPTTMAAPTPFRHFNRNPSSPVFEGERSGLPRSLSGPLHRKLGLSCTPVQCLLTLSPSSAGFYLASHCRFALCEGFLAVSLVKERLPDDFHAIPIV